MQVGANQNVDQKRRTKENVGGGRLVNGEVTTPPIASPGALFVAGLLGGVASTLAGHPFDTIKVPHLPFPL
jgi:hypothetical protein